MGSFSKSVDISNDYKCKLTSETHRKINHV